MVKRRQKGQRQPRSDSEYGDDVPDAVAEVWEIDEPAPSPGLAAAVAAMVVAVHLACYVSTLSPSVLGGDSGELIAVSHVLGVPHPPGYPTFTLVNKLFTTLIPVGTVAWKSNLLAAICASGAGLFLHLSVVELTNSLAAGVLAAGLFSFARLQWLYSITGEVFAMNNLFCAVLMHQTVRYQRSPTLCKACLGAFTCGLALTNQHTTILYIIIIAPWVLWRGGNIGDIGEPAAAPAKGGSGTSTAGGGLLRPGPVAALTACALLGLSPYIFTYLSALRNTASLTWGDQRTLPGFWKHLSREEYGTFDLAKGNRESASFWRAIEMHLTALADETFWICPLLSVLGAIAPLKHELQGAKIPIIGSLVFYMGFFNWRANLDISNPLLAGVQERFWMQPNLILNLLAGVGFAGVLKATRRWIPGGEGSGAPLAVAWLLVSAQIANNLNERDESQNTFVQEFGTQLLEGLPKDAILLTLGDLPGNAARYVQTCEHVRPDIRLIDLEMMTYEWYLPMLAKNFPGVTFPAEVPVYRHGAKYFNMKTFFDANIDKFDIFVYENLNPDDPSWENDYEIWRHGTTRAIKRKGTKVDAKAWLASAMPAVPNSTLPDPAKYDDRTWEHVVYEGNLAAGIYLAMFFEHKSKAQPRDAVALNEAAVEVYEFMYSSPAYSAHIQDFWHKNTGLAYHNLHSLTRKKEYGLKMKKYWQMYVDTNPDDAQVAQIQGMIDGIKD